MKHLLGFLVLLLSLGTVSAQNDTLSGDYRTALSLHPFPIIGSTMKVSADLRLSSRGTGRITLAYGASEEPGYYDFNNMDEFRAEFQYRYFFNKAQQTMDGFYAGPYAYFKTVSFTITEGTPQVASPDRIGEDAGANAGMGGLLIGWQRVFPSNLMIDGYFGTGLMRSGGDDALHEASFNAYSTGIQVYLGGSIGLVIE